jgi:hypothetical protein
LRAAAISGAVLQGDVDVLRIFPDSPEVEHGRMKALDIGRRDYGLGSDEDPVLWRDDAAMGDDQQGRAVAADTGSVPA